MQQQDDHSQFYLDVLREVVSQPTAPFHEERVAARIAAYLREWGIPFTVDEAGNIIARYQHGAPCRPLVLMAHMDHPAFAVTAPGGPDGADWTAALRGGVGARCFEQPVAVRIFPDGPNAAEAGVAAHVAAYRQGDQPRAVELYLTLDEPAVAGTIKPGDFGVWDLLDFELRDGFIHARAIDDLVGCAAALLALWQVACDGAETALYGVFTRAEEVGLVGAAAAIRHGSLPTDAYIVSLEASPALPGALQGEGPVIRAGDRAVTFSETAEVILKAAADRLGSNVWRPAQRQTTKVQRQLMTGGRCEGGATMQAGFATTGLAFPLANYHNVAEGYTLAPEYISVSDYLTGVALLQEAARLMPALDGVLAQLAAPYDPTGALTAQLMETAGRIKAATAG